MRISLFLAIIVLTLTSVSSSNAFQQSSPTPKTSITPEPLNTLPKSVLEAKLKSAKGRSFRLSDYSGSILVVNLWATWVGPSRLETPELVKLQKQFRSQGVKFVGLSTENPNTSARQVRKWIRDFRVNYKVGWATSEVALQLMRGHDAIPQTLVFSRTGRIVKRFVGFHLQRTPELFKLAIEEALNERAGPAETN